MKLTPHPPLDGYRCPTCGHDKWCAGYNSSLGVHYVCEHCFLKHRTKLVLEKIHDEKTEVT